MREPATVWRQRLTAHAAALRASAPAVPSIYARSAVRKSLTRVSLSASECAGEPDHASADEPIQAWYAPGAPSASRTPSAP
jgi:hypothetical protein